MDLQASDSDKLMPISSTLIPRQLHGQTHRQHTHLVTVEEVRKSLSTSAPPVVHRREMAVCRLRGRGLSQRHTLPRSIHFHDLLNWARVKLHHSHNPIAAPFRTGAARYKAILAGSHSSKGKARA